MYNIVEEMTNTACGLGLTEQGTNLINTGINTTGDTITSLVNSKNAAKIAESNAEAEKYKAQAAYYNSQYAGGNPSTYAPNTTGGYVMVQGQQQQKDWTPWLIGGGIAIAGLLLIMTVNNKRR